MLPSVPLPPRARDPIGFGALALLIVAAAWVVWHRALGTFFSQDDFASLARAAGMAPRLHGPWRYVGIQLTFDVLYSMARLNAFPYHLASLMVHCGASVLLFLLLARRVSRGAAFTAAVFFAVHPALITAVYWASVICDSLALLFGLAALALVEESGGRRWLAVPLFALSLLSKESTLLLPLAAMWLVWREPGFAVAPRGGSDLRRTLLDPPRLALLALSAAYLVYFAASAYPTYFVPPGHAAAAPARSGAAAYSLGLGPGLLWNFLTLTGWAVNFVLPTVRGFTDAVDPSVYPWAAAALLAWLLGLRSAALRRSGWLTGGVLYLAFVLPVLPLGHHTYHYYLYAPLTGVAWCVAALVETTTARLGPAGRRLAAAALTCLLTWNGYALVLKDETMPFLVPELRSDPVIDRARIAARVYESLRAADLPAGARLAFWSPALVAMSRAEHPDSAAGVETYMERNVRSALLDGLAVRVMFPGVDSVRFVRAYRSLPQPWRYAVYRMDGSLRVAPSSELDTVLTRFPGLAPARPPG